MQMRYVRGVLTTVGEPEGGYYILVADVYPGKAIVGPGKVAR